MKKRRAETRRLNRESEVFFSLLLRKKLQVETEDNPILPPTARR
jgi:hypothetical protein